MRRLLLLLVALSVAGLPGRAGAAPAIPTLEVQVPSRDGAALLATSVFLPAGPADAKWPVILRRTPYGRGMDADGVAGLNALGYAFVSQDVRGRGDSTGRFLPFFNDHDDAADALEWIAAQPWCDGHVGSWGGSAEGVVQLMALPGAPAVLKCANVLAATEDVYAGMMPGGAWRDELTTAWLKALDSRDVYDEWRAHEAGDSYWDAARLDATEVAQVDVPVLLGAGFFDIFAKDMPRVLRTFRAQGGPAARSGTYLVLGPWTHGGFNPTAGQLLMEGEVLFPPEAAYNDLVRDLVDLFGWCLKGGPRPSWPAVRYWTTTLDDDGRSATGSWHGADDWPPPSTPARLFLHADGRLDATPPGADDAPAALPFDPASPVPSLGGGNLTTAAGPMDQAAIDTRPDVVFADTPTVTEPLRLVGDVTAEVWATASGTDADVVVRLSQVTPSGRVMLMADGIRRGRFAGGTGTAVPLVPGQPTLFQVEVGPVALDLLPGHALRVAIAPSSAPRYEANPGTATPLADKPAPVKGTLSILRDEGHPTSIRLPFAWGMPAWAEAPATADDAVPDAADPDAADPVPDVPTGVDAVDGQDQADATGPGLDAPPSVDTATDPGNVVEPVKCPASGGCAQGPSPAPVAWVLLALACATLAARRRRGG